MTNCCRCGVEVLDIESDICAECEEILIESDRHAAMVEAADLRRIEREMRDELPELVGLDEIPF